VLSPDKPLDRADVRIRDGAIVEVGSNLVRDDEERVDASEFVVMPGLINGHTHSGQSVQRGAAPNLPLEMWIGCVLYGDSPLSSEDTYAAAAALSLDLLQAGCTAVLDHVFLDVDDLGEQAEAVIAAYVDTGIRAAVAPVVQDLDYLTTVATGFEIDVDQPEPVMAPRDPRALLRSLTAFLESWTGTHERISPLIGPAAPQRCSDELLGGIAELVHERGTGIHTHLLESKSQVVATRARFGTSVVEHLANLGLLGPHASFAHGIWLDEAEYLALSRSGSVLVHNPIAALRCGSGILPLQELLKLELALGLGADGAAANDGQNMFETMKFATLLHTLYGDFRSWLQPQTVWELGLRGGAAALRQPLGAIEAGAAADVVLVRADRHELSEKDRLLRSLVLSEDGSSVDTVIVGGEVVVRDGSSTRVDEAAIRAQARAATGRWHARHVQRSDLYHAVEPFLAAIADEARDVDLGLARRAHVALASTSNGRGGSAGPPPSISAAAAGDSI
jgi:5-methylthioadenosine/S-adenosylhomocysteine deaminase